VISFNLLRSSHKKSLAEKLTFPKGLELFIASPHAQAAGLKHVEI
jgi:hypothetical protein